MKLPAGWKAQLPPSVKTESPFGSYESTYAQNGNELVLTKRTSGATGVYPPEKVKEVAAWFRELGKDDAKLIVISKH
jgi:hypothetical protein